MGDCCIFGIGHYFGLFVRSRTIGGLMMTTFYLAKGESRHFSFHAMGETEEKALAALQKSLTRHGKQYQISPSWWKDATNIDIYVQEIKLGKGYRDGGEL